MWLLVNIKSSPKGPTESQLGSGDVLPNINIQCTPDCVAEFPRSLGNGGRFEDVIAKTRLMMSGSKREGIINAAEQYNTKQDFLVGPVGITLPYLRLVDLVVSHYKRIFFDIGVARKQRCKTSIGGRPSEIAPRLTHLSLFLLDIVHVLPAWPLWVSSQNKVNISGDRVPDILYDRADLDTHISIGQKLYRLLNSKVDIHPWSLTHFELLRRSFCCNGSRIGRFLHFIPLVSGYYGIDQYDQEHAEGNPSTSRFPKPIYLVTSSAGIIILGAGWWVLVYSNAMGGRTIFRLANAAIPISAILCLYGFNGMLIWSVGP
jgi:hypothetical protein